MKTVDDILSAISKCKGLKSDIALAKLFGVKQNTVSTWRSRGTVPYDMIIAFCEHEGISLDSLFLGKGEAKPTGGAGLENGLSANVDLIFEVIEKTELLFEKHKLYLPPRKKIKLLRLLYEEILEDESAVNMFDEKVISITRGLAV